MACVPKGQRSLDLRVIREDWLRQRATTIRGTTNSPWNPRNVVLAGQGSSATFKESGRIRVLPPHRLFKEVTAVEVPGAGRFEGYANRDSLAYEKIMV